MLLGGLPDVPQQVADKAVDFGKLILLWLENPAHWWPAAIIIVGIAAWRGTLDETLKGLAEVVRAFRGKGKNGKSDVD